MIQFRNEGIPLTKTYICDFHKQPIISKNGIGFMGSIQFTSNISTWVLGK